MTLSHHIQAGRQNRFHAENPFVDIPPAVYLTTRLAVILFATTILLFAPFSDTPHHLTALRVIASILYLCVSCAPLLFKFPKVGIFHPLFFLSAYGFARGTLPHLRAMALGDTRNPGLPTWSVEAIAELQVKIILIETLAWCMILIGYFVARGISWRILEIRDNRNALSLLSVFAFGVGVFAFIQITLYSGGFSLHLKNIVRGVAHKVYVVDDVEMISIYAVMVWLTMLAPAMMLLNNRNATLNPMFWVLALTSTAMLFLVNGRRSAILRPVIVFLSCWIFKTKKVAFGRVAIVGLLLFLSVGVAGSFRRSNWTGKSEVNFDFLEDLDFQTSFLLSLDEMEARRSGGAVYPIVALVPDKVEYKYGRNYLNYLNRFIPRIFWKDKPRGIGIECADVFYRKDKGIPPGSIGEAYWSGGIIGVALVFLAWGVILKSVGNFLVQHRDSNVACILYLMTIAVLQPSETGFRAWLFLFGPAALILISVGAIRLSSGNR